MKAQNNGIVYLVGAGPGDFGLLTLRGASLLKEADAVVYDGLVNPEILGLAPYAEKIYAGKAGAARCVRPFLMGSDPKGSDPFKTQSDINRLLVRLAKQGKMVVRLKGGDPFIFGRGGEEALYLRKQKIRFEVVPGVSAANAVPAYAGIPVTDRHDASLVTLVTANEDPSKKNPAIDWKKLAGLSGTLVLFMGVRSLASVARKLIRAGKSPKTLAAVIEGGTLPHQRVVEGTLAAIAGKVRAKKIQSPALTVIGEVNRFRKEIEWYSKRPLQGKRVLVTRASSQAGSLRFALEGYGAEVVEYPVLRIEPPRDFGPLDRAIQNLSEFDWILFTSTNGVDAFFERMPAIGKDARALSGIRVAAIGDATRKALVSRGIVPDLTPSVYTTEGLLGELSKRRAVQKGRFLLPRTDIAPEFLRKKLEEGGAEVTEVVAYRTVPHSEFGKRKAESSTAFRFPRSAFRGRSVPDFITFTSSSTVRNFFNSVPKAKWPRGSKMVSIGPVTTETLKEYGFKPYREAKEHTIQGVVKAIVGTQKAEC